jgi:hypothetical protein
MRGRGDDPRSARTASALGIRLNVVAVVFLLLLEWALLTAYFRAHSAVQPQVVSLASVAEDRPASLLRSGGSVRSSAQQQQQQQQPSHSPLVGVFVPASNDVGPLATQAGCPHWAQLETADPKVSTILSGRHYVIVVVVNHSMCTCLVLVRD